MSTSWLGSWDFQLASARGISGQARNLEILPERAKSFLSKKISELSSNFPAFRISLHKENPVLNKKKLLSPMKTFKK